MKTGKESERKPHPEAAHKFRPHPSSPCISRKPAHGAVRIFFEFLSSLSDCSFLKCGGLAESDIRDPDHSTERALSKTKAYTRSDGDGKVGSELTSVPFGLFGQSGYRIGRSRKHPGG